MRLNDDNLYTPELNTFLATPCADGDEKEGEGDRVQGHASMTGGRNIIVMRSQGNDDSRSGGVECSDNDAVTTQVVRIVNNKVTTASCAAAAAAANTASSSLSMMSLLGSNTGPLLLLNAGNSGAATTHSVQIMNNKAATTAATVASPTSSSLSMMSLLGSNTRPLLLPNAGHSDATTTHVVPIMNNRATTTAPPAAMASSSFSMMSLLGSNTGPSLLPPTAGSDTTLQGSKGSYGGIPTSFASSAIAHRNRPLMPVSTSSTAPMSSSNAYLNNAPALSSTFGHTPDPKPVTASCHDMSILEGTDQDQCLVDSGIITDENLAMITAHFNSMIHHGHT